MKFKQGKVFVLAFAGAVLANSSAAHAQGYPSRSLTLVVPFGVGSGADLMARVLAVPMSETLGQTVVIENVPGAGDRKSTRLNSSHMSESRMPSSA